jgi:PAS domain S-box-containing protein
MALLSFGLVAQLKFGPGGGIDALLESPLAWTLLGATPLFAALGWVVGDRRRERELAIAQWESTTSRDLHTLAEREWLTRGVLQTAFDAVLVIDDDEIVVDANPTATRVFGLEPDELLGLPVAQLLPQHRTLGTTLAITRRTAGGEVLGKEWQTQAVHADGHRFPVDLNIVALRGPGLLFYAIREATTRVANERKRVDDARVAWEAQREEHQRARGGQLLDLGASLRAELDHLLDELGALRAEGIDRPALDDASFALLVVLERLQALSVWERSDAALSIAPIAVSAMVDEAVRAVAPLARHRGNVLTVRCDHALGELETDAIRLSAALRALVVNAAVHAHDAEITVAVDREPGQGTDWLTASVHDTGPGLDPASRERIYQLFRGNPNVLSVAPGDGLGLKLAHRMARTLGGHISVSFDQGTTFLLRVPLDPEISIEPGPPRPLRLDSDA